jgi:hypothetical protein
MVCLFSTVFPSYHFMAGKPTNFVDKILNGEKIHTIRAGERWKDGDMMDFRNWANKPYRSRQIQFKEPAPIKPQPIILSSRSGDLMIKINGEDRQDVMRHLAAKDGLHLLEFYYWFAKNKKDFEFKGQILHWTDFKY